MPAASEKRRKAQRWGHASEWLAAFSLLIKGYRIIAMRYKTKLGEVDLIARRGDLVAMVEVKARKDVSSAVDAVTHTSQHRIRSAGDLWLSSQSDAARLSIRYDIVAVRPWRWPVHLPDAF